MANLFIAEKEIRDLMKMYDLDDWTFKFNRRKQALGVCYYRAKRIELSSHFVMLNTLDDMRDTMLHEIAHALAWLKYGDKAGHDFRWVQIARAIGCIGERNARNKDIRNPKGRFQYLCAECGDEVRVHRRFKRRKACADCCTKYAHGKFDERFLMVLQRS